MDGEWKWKESVRSGEKNASRKRKKRQKKRIKNDQEEKSKIYEQEVWLEELLRKSGIEKRKKEREVGEGKRG